MLHLDQWIGMRIRQGPSQERPLRCEEIEKWQRERLKETVSHACRNAPFYRRRKEAYEEFLEEEDSCRWHQSFSRLPFTTPKDLSEHGQDMICVPQSQISRIVSLQTGGSSGIPKRVYFTEEDQELTVDFFDHGMRLMVEKGDHLVILMPYEAPGSVGDLLSRGVRRIGASVTCLGLLHEEKAEQGETQAVTYAQAACRILALRRESNPHRESGGQRIVLVGIPTQIRTLMEKAPELPVDRVLLSADYVSDALAKQLEETWHCQVFEHYGMTEMGLGCAVSCGQGEGYHIRENDLYIEIIDPNTERRLPDGQWGEIVFSTLTRRAMPLIRYRTGDISRILTAPCPCGSVLRRLDRVKARNFKKGWT